MIVLAGMLAALAGCGSEEAPETPTACLGPPSDYLKALEAAPGEVRLAGTTAISDCLVEDQASGPLQTVGKSLVDAASELNREVRGDPGSDAAIQLGYLVGSVQEGAASTGGIHEDLVIRLDSAARFTGSEGKAFSAEFERAYGEGYAAGQANG